MKYAYRLLNVFATQRSFSGNPLCVFENGDGLSAPQMQALARQFNLSETTFILKSAAATAGVRIFTPSYEMPFAGHPTLGTASVVADLKSVREVVTLEMPAGIIPVTRRDGVDGLTWELKANPPQYKEFSDPVAGLASALTLSASAILGPVRWINSGNEQLLVPVASHKDVLRASPVSEALRDYGEQFKVLVFHETGESVKARFFFRQLSGFAEDPATGSACANLGGWHLAQGTSLPLQRIVSQGEEIYRPSELHLRVDESRGIYVAGRVVEIGRGFVAL